MRDRIKRKIESYRNSDDQRPLLVDVSTIEDLHEILQNYFTICKKDIFELIKPGAELPQISDIHEYMGNCDEKLVLLTGLGSYLRLMGTVELNRLVNSILTTSYSTKFIILTYQCSKYINKLNPRIKEKVITWDNDDFTPPSSIVIIPAEYRNLVKAENGLKNALIDFEKRSGETVYVTTFYTLKDLKDSLIRIEECKSPYDVICLKDSSLKRVSDKCGTPQQWSSLLEKLQNNSVEDTIKEFVKCKDIVLSIREWENKTSFEKWLLFLFLKLKHLKTDNWAINYSIDISQNEKDFIKNIYYSLCDIDHKEPGFWSKYNDRKEILKYINEDNVVYQYCKYIQYKNENVLYYLTDNTKHEKKLALMIIDRYKEKFSRKILLDVLQKTFPDLYWYLADYNLGDEYLNHYFNEYKYLKILNTLTDEFKLIVDEEALARSFKRRLICRSEVLNDINYTNSFVYFIDALGVEFLSYIEKLCREKDLACKVSICRSNLPSITEKNTEFREFFRNKSVEIKEIKDLDKLKHSGKEDYDFDKNRLPFYLIDELEVIENCIDNIRLKIKSQIIKKAVIVSDHGATRLAILNGDMIREDVESIGEHGGRVCKVVENMRSIPNAIIENDCYILADYNAFKGGRIGKVEMHGGATLEEVTIPIIEITEKNTYVDIKILTPVVKVSYKTNAVIKFFSSSYLEEASIRINGKNYVATSNDNYNFSVILDDIKKSGEYKFDIWSDGELIAFENTFKVEQESATSVDLWG